MAYNQIEVDTLFATAEDVRLSLPNGTDSVYMYDRTSQTTYPLPLLWVVDLNNALDDYDSSDLVSYLNICTALIQGIKKKESLIQTFRGGSYFPELIFNTLVLIFETYIGRLDVPDDLDIFKLPLKALLDHSLFDIHTCKNPFTGRLFTEYIVDTTDDNHKKKYIEVCKIEELLSESLFTRTKQLEYSVQCNPDVNTSTTTTTTHVTTNEEQPFVISVQQRKENDTTTHHVAWLCSYQAIQASPYFQSLFGGFQHNSNGVVPTEVVLNGSAEAIKWVTDCVNLLKEPPFLPSRGSSGATAANAATTEEEAMELYMEIQAIKDYIQLQIPTPNFTAEYKKLINISTKKLLTDESGNVFSIRKRTRDYHDFTSVCKIDNQIVSGITSLNSRQDHPVAFPVFRDTIKLLQCAHEHNMVSEFIDWATCVLKREEKIHNEMTKRQRLSN